ncbi:hypothetical protein PUNSTDRAFT_138273 [Punctularia strigosozonata HHB-11173 SS5]|uniref:MYND-type domain-containing protein n=1 Tax=Punctularia strigosozonata (strain HHB-11173) TaxID=741275 RepID=R7S4A1_PUNST|nr:uncharacterized protein PUNSTDRAFT_138273 [Punctularia strigosozonata HHB-11173 SS5]EIN04622.1 hypothetical protein PUNSTDRAFT_138273 [Punctularia strigosozonata HHB-11173 SS5]
MAAVYSTPAAANYFSPAPCAMPQRGYRLCDQCQAVENPAGQRFRLCGGCMAAQYCSSNCQKANWPTHRAVCQHTQSAVSASKQHPLPDGGSVDLAKSLRRFTSAHQMLLSWAGFQALQVKRVPANARQYALVVELAHDPTAADPLRRFTVAHTALVPRAAILARDPVVAEDTARRDERSRRAGGLGALLVLVQCEGLSQVMPVETDAPARVSWDTRADWEDVLRKFVREARADFKPISTTAQGVYYG